MDAGTRSWWGWGIVDQAVPDGECVQLAAALEGLPDAPLRIPAVAELAMSPPRIVAPTALAAIVSDSPEHRASHTYGKAYRDVVRALDGDLANAPDLVAFARTEADVVAVLDWAGADDIAVVPFGGGSSVVGGVEYRGERPAVSLDLTGLNRVLEVDATSRAARIQAGALGPALEEQLHRHGVTLRHFPQSFEFSTLGGWLATRAGGHYATGPTHIDDFVESMRVVTPAGACESWRLPGSGAGPSPDRLFLGSEGALGVITEAWMRVQDRPSHKASAAVTFADFTAALAAVRAIAQSGLNPANCRLLDPGEAAMSGSGDGANSVLVLGLESARFPVHEQLAQLVDLARQHGGAVAARKTGAVDAWRSAFLRMPYLRDGLARMSAIVETFETATTWDRLPGLIDAVRIDAAVAVQDVCGVSGMLNCRLTHAYPDGAAPYFTVIAPGRRGSELAMWDEIKAAVSETLVRHRATITHHHGVGRDHRPSYDQQRPDLFAAALRAAKSTVDPQHILNPGVLVD